ncbi:hypothetical protein HO173_001228 [Letharia columbiana]|uniref:Peptidase S59 domain-containing protein n=1 Tax=Letharia columbiana TaxID=112416 RepID=A0A8H6G4Q7_9LECA|nr:uncharacterized protein HO173_001228 [Letharia columbiana]KAF6240559.1 hypothetical protein HO173_001228 [Letharia columbiana]
MSFSGFGQNSNQPQQSAGFGGFGSNNNTTGTGFGQPQNSGFGTGSGSTLFGSSTNTGGGFGSGTGSFGVATTNTTPFGQNRPAFGASTTTGGTGLFGSGTATAGPTSGFGGFGSTTNNNNTSGGGLFGSTQKPAFGGGNTGGGLFGTGNAGGGFGSTNNQQQTGAFGAPISSALGTNNAECQGTGSTPFSAYTEKEGTGNTNNHFQSVSFMQPYKNFSFEELRLADYNQGRRFGNASGQPAAFGQTNFGGFGQPQNTTGGFGQPANTGGGLFGQPPTASSSPFGSTQPAQSGFGTGTGGGLFGSKPGTNGSLFGQSNAASTSQQSGGIFGTTGGTNAGFGSGAGTGSGFGGGGGIFGGNNEQQQQQSKPFSFGGTTATTGGGFGTGSSGFGTNNNTTTNTSGGIFGNAGQTNTPFGQTQQQPAQQNPFGGFGTQNQNQSNSQPPFGGFGTQQQQEQKPGGIFGGQTANNTGGGGLFGNLNQNNQPQGSSGGLFGTNNNNQSSGSSLFAPKPAATGGSLFGTTNTGNSNQGGGLFPGFGNNNNNANQNQQNQAGGLFGNNNNQQQKPGSLFSGSTGSTGSGLFSNLNNNNQQPTGGSLFGSNNQQQQQQGGSLFGNTNNNQGSSLFGSSQQQQQQPNALAPPPVFNASLIDPNNAYGSPSIFSGLPPPPVAVGPIATPINIKQKTKKNAVLPHYKMAPNAASRLVTPQKRGFGFSYSTYGTPGSATSNASTPGGLGSSLMFGSVGRGLGKSLSTSNLRRNLDSDSESILTPGAFSAGSSRYGGAGSLKRLTIDRSLRTPDLFGDKGALPALPSPEKSDQSKQPGILKKKVSFDASTVGGNGENPNGVQVNGAIAVNGADMTSSATPSAEEQGFLRTPSRGQGRLAGAKSNGVVQQPEMEQVRGNELAVVHEDESSEPSSTSNARAPFQMPQDDEQPGAYWMKPSETELQKLPKDQRKQIRNFSVGRDGCGRVEFNTPVDLSFTDLKEIYGNIVLVELRSLTVYPDQTKKPALGKGLNVPSTIYLANSWPRQKDRRTLLPEKSGPRFNRHVDRLRKVGGTEFVRYEKDTGIWVFRVPHFTKYGFDYEDDDASEGESLQTSMLSELPGTPTPVSRAMRNDRTPTATTSTQRSLTSANESSGISSSPEDTFEFRKKKILPGAFEDQEEISDNEHDGMEQVRNDESFLDERLAASPSDSGEDEPSELRRVKGGIEDRSLVVRDEEQDMEIEMAGAFPSPDLDEAPPKSFLQLGYGTPGKATFNVGGDWAEELQRTISPRKQDRQALRETQVHLLKDRDVDEEKTPNAKRSGKVTGSKLATSIDLMNSLFGQEQARRDGRNAKQATKGKVVKWPYSKRSNINDDAMSNMTPEQQQMEREWRDSYKPAWGPGETLLYAIPGKVGSSSNKSAQTDPILQKLKGSIVSEGRDIRFAKFAKTPNLVPTILAQQQARTKFSLERGVPMAKLQQTPFKNIASLVQPPSQYEQSVWELASILFDDQNSEAYGVPAAYKATYDHRIRKDRLIHFWKRQCQETAMKAVSAAPNAEERAIAHLSANNVVEACDALVQGRDFRLATLVAQIGGDQIMRDDVTAQIAKWRELNVLSEITEPIRALYSLLAGDTCVCEGKKGPTEDRAKTFVISERFNLDWKRAFGLRLFYAILAEDTIEAAVVKFEHDLQSDEGKKPVPRFVEEKTGAPWDDPKTAQREDVLWGLLKIYAASKSALPTSSLAGILAPENITGNPVDARLSFQLYHAINARFPAIADPSKADYLAQTFAAQLDSAGEWYWALFSLLHLSSYRQRHLAIQSLLIQHAEAIPSDSKSELFETLTELCKIPVAWIWEAKALYARSVLQDHVQEVDLLVKAQDWKEAHEVFRKEVGPSTVVEQDWDTLQGVLDSFMDCKEQIAEWGMGGQVYDDYLSLMKGVEGHEKEELLQRLLGALPMMMRGGKRDLKETVAVQEISGFVGKEVLAMKEKGMEGARVLQLPLTEDAYLKHTMDLSLQYYKAVMTGGK